MPWQYFVKNWIRRAAGEKIKASFAEGLKARQEGSAGVSPASATDKDRDEPKTPITAAVIFADPLAAGCLADRLQGRIAIRGKNLHADEGGLAGRGVIVARTEASDPREIQRTVEAVIDGHSPRWIIAADLATALDSRLQLGHILMADCVADAQGKRRTIDLHVDPEELRKTKRVHVGRLLTWPDPIRVPERRRELGQTHEALAAERIALPAAVVCQQRQVPFMAIVAVAVGPSESLSGDIENLTRQKSWAGRLGAATRALAKRPSSAKEMWMLKENALVAGDRLAEFLEGVISQLSPSSTAVRPQNNH